MFKVSTQSFNTIQKLKNMTSLKGKVANHFAKSLVESGYPTVYQRNLKGDVVALMGKNSSGDTKTFLLSGYGFSVKTNKIKPVTEHTAVREIDKSEFNQFGEEISGLKKIQRLINKHIFDTKIEKRGWVGVNN